MEYKYGATNIKCSGKKECRIRPGASYMCADDDVYCMRCFGVEKRKKKDNILGDINNWRQLENVVETFEVLKECGDCGGLWHESCSMTLATTTFICYKCITGYSIPKIEIKHECPLSQFMSERMNKLCGKPVTRNTGIAVVNFTSRRTVDLVADRPDHLKEQFRNKYGNTTNCTQRMIYVIQRTSKADVIFFSMICHEYENHAGTKYCLIDTLDSVPYFTPTATVSRGAAHHEVMLSYFDFMRRVGFEKAHLWANAPVQGDNMIFTCHPMEQKYLSQVELEGYYEKMLAKGEKSGIFKKWRNFGGFKEDVERYSSGHSNLRKKKDYKGIHPIHIPIFEGSQWEYFNQKYDPEPEDKENSEAANFMRKFTRNIPDNLTNTFWMDLKKPDEPMDPELLEGRRNSHEDLGDKMSFLELCVENNWEFSSLRRAQFATMGIIDMINRFTVVQE
ncbi:hypothetical protein CRE_12449 [Caenorhabditis remanei]|uniref:histone acetyltransferase n=1 Tax=Caenorhabditis remanei TaxID=31234 RepID=E3NMY8_CAERE|nr:hypothetical protein CRE_12449 [Caenorhabditis remanei]